jgi:hypothetical protein
MKTSEIQTGDLIKVTKIGNKVGRTYQVAEITHSASKVAGMCWIKVLDERMQGMDSYKEIAILDFDSIELIQREGVNA